MASQENIGNLGARNFQQAFDNLLEGCQIIDFNFRYVYLNDAAVKQSKQSREKLLGRTMMEKYPGIENTELFSNIKACMTGRTPSQMENEFIFPDGSKGWFELRIEPVPEGVFILSIDITKNKIAENELKKVNSNLEALVELSTAELQNEKNKIETFLQSIGEGVVGIDTQGKITIFNKAASIISGFSDTDAIGRQFSEIIRLINRRAGESGAPTSDTKDLVPLEKHPLTIALNSGEKIETNITSVDKYYYVRKDGTEFPVEITAAPVALNNKVIGIIMIFRDITMEREFDIKKSEFISLASHQLKTPPTAIKWNLELLIEDQKDLKPDQARAIKDMYTMNNRMMETIRSLLNVSRLEMGNYIIEPQTINYIDVMKDVIQAHKQKIDIKKIKIEESYDPDIPMITTDPDFARIICDNLISNAVKYTPEGGSINVSIKYKKESNAIKISVSDTGVGIPASQQSQIFTKMFRADNVKSTTEGTGFGLYFLKSIVDISGGKVWFKSQEGKGSAFYVELPTTGMKKKEGTSKLEIV